MDIIMMIDRFTIMLVLWSNGTETGVMVGDEGEQRYYDGER
jgi:hypothetical protein